MLKRADGHVLRMETVFKAQGGEEELGRSGENGRRLIRRRVVLTNTVRC